MLTLCRSDDDDKTPRLVERPTSILLVEDDTNAAKMIEYRLRHQEHKFRLVWRSDLQGALQAMQETDFDAILCDLELPDATQLEALLAIRSADPRVPIVVLTAHSEQSVGLEAIRCGADDFLIKDKLNVDMLVRSLRYAVERKRCEQLRMRVDAFEDLISMLSHDMRAPLIGATRVIECMERADSSEADRADLLRLLKESNQRLLSLVTDLVEVYRIELTPPSLFAHATEFSRALEPALRALSAVLHIKEQTVDLDIDPNLPKLFIDRDSLERVLTSLLDNASKFSPEGTRITLRAHSIEGTSKVRIAVIDNGSGIPAELQQTLFKRFSFATPSRAYSTSGGLGLYLSHKIIASHGGTISFNTSPEGTSFTVVVNGSNRHSKSD